MNNKKALSIVLLLMALLPVSIGTVSASAPSLFSISLAPPPGAFDLSDLDARDEFNRPLPEAHARLEQLFVRSVMDLLLANRSGVQRAINFVLEHPWNGHDAWWRSARQRAFRTLSAFVSERTKRADLRLDSAPRCDLHFSEAEPRHASFFFLMARLLASTRLLR